MSAEQRLSYVDSSALVKLAVAERESKALHGYLARRLPPVSSALARTEMARALMPSGWEAVARGEEVLRRIQLLRVNDRVLREAGRMALAKLRSLDAIHLSSARQLGVIDQRDHHLRRAHGGRGSRVRLVGRLTPLTNASKLGREVAAFDLLFMTGGRRRRPSVCMTLRQPRQDSDSGRNGSIQSR